MGALDEVARELASGRKLAVFHPLADCDAVGSAVALKRAFGGLDLSAAGGMSRLAKKLLEALGETALESPEFGSYDKLVVLDTSNLSGLGVPPEALSGKRLIIMDHHLRVGSAEGKGVYYTDEAKPSCSEVVFELLRAAGKRVDREGALGLSAGILTDTAHLRFGRSGTLRTLVEVLEEGGVQLEEVLALLEDDRVDVSRKIAFLKGAQRVRFEQFGENVIALSHVSAFEGALSKALLSLGADIAFVGAQDRREFRVSGRATQALVRKGFHVGRIMEAAGKDLGGQGGGHAGAAGMSGEGEMEAALNILAEKAGEALRELASGR